MDNLTNYSVAELNAAYRSGDLSPVEVTQAYLDRIDVVDSDLHAYITVTDELALAQAKEAEQKFSTGDLVQEMTGIPTAVKDAFHVADYPTSLGSILYRDIVSKADSGLVRRLKNTGCVILGKTNTAEFGQSATCDNLLGRDTKNPWDITRTPGGSSGGSAAAIAARLAAVSVGSDGGGSIRIPAAFTGIYGLKTSYGLIPDEKGFRAMTDFVGAGPMTSSVADSRSLMKTLTGRDYSRTATKRLRVAYCPQPEGRPVQREIREAVRHVSELLASLGHDIVETELPIQGWDEIFGPLVLEDEQRERGHLLEFHADRLTRYEKASLKAARNLTSASVGRAREQLPEYRQRISDFFEQYDVILTPATAMAAFPLDERPEMVDGQHVDKLWGPYPFSVPFNVAGVTGASIPCGFAEGLPVAAQIIAADRQEQLVMDLSEDLEEAVGFDTLGAARRWTPTWEVSS